MPFNVRHVLRTSGGASAFTTMVALVLAMGAASAGAQTRFAWPDTTVPLARYATIEQCMAAIGRALGDAKRREALIMRRDTAPVDPKAALAPAPAPVTETARRCGTRYVEPTAPLTEFAPLLRLYLASGRDADAASLVARRLAAVPAARTREVVAVRDTAVDIYLDARPMRLELAEKLLLERARSSSNRLERIELYSRLMSAAQGARDSARTERAARLVVRLADSLTTAERESEQFDKLGPLGGRFVIYQAMRAQGGIQVMLDSLRHGTAALVALERSMWVQATGERPEALPMPIGERAPAITADYWFPRATPDTVRPRPGRVSLIVFLDAFVAHECLHLVSIRGDVDDDCPRSLAILRRLSERFPALEVTIVTGTRGSFLYVPPPTPTEEATLVGTWLDAYRIPRAVVAITSTPFWNLPRPDARRIDKDSPNQTRYNFGKSWKARGQTFLVDQDGIVVAPWGYDEDDMAQFIEVLLNRQVGGTDRGAR